MEMYVVVDDCISSKGCIYEKFFKTLEQGEVYADAEWESLSNHDKELRDAYYVSVAEVKPEYEIDYESMDIIASWK